MKKFEYKVEAFQHADVNVPIEEQFAKLEKFLNSKGDSGWELCKAEAEEGTSVFIFKRELK